MLDLSLSVELDIALAMEEYYRTKLLYWRYRRRELEQQIESESQHIIDEFQTIANGAWDNDDSQPFSHQSQF